MTFQERAILKDNLEKILMVLDSDEGIRIDNEFNRIFVNKISKRYCVDISTANKDEFIYKTDIKEVMDFLKGHMTESSKIFAY